jgi:hypothetical protein
VTLEIAADALEEMARNGIVADQAKFHAPGESGTA